MELARSAQMALIRSRDTKVEMRVRKYLHATGLRYRLYVRSLPGTPDLVFPARQTVLFVHGCFWHRHPGCAAARLPKTKQEFWEEKLAGNVARDARQQSELERLGWTVLIIWECETKDPTKLLEIANRIKTSTHRSTLLAPQKTNPPHR